MRFFLALIFVAVRIRPIAQNALNKAGGRLGRICYRGSGSEQCVIARIDAQRLTGTASLGSIEAAAGSDASLLNALPAESDSRVLETRRRHHHRHRHHRSHGGHHKATQRKHHSSAHSTQSHLSGVGSHGTATWFTQDGTTGACGRKVSDHSKSVAMCPSLYRQKCFETVHITDTVTGKSITATVTDECPECSCNHLDLSLGAYDALGQSRDVGVLNIKFSL